MCVVKDTNIHTTIQNTGVRSFFFKETNFQQGYIK